MAAGLRLLVIPPESGDPRDPGRHLRKNDEELVNRFGSSWSSAYAAAHRFGSIGAE